MTPQNQDRAMLIRLGLEKAADNLEAARSFRNSYPGEAVRAAYYSAFHVVNALFLHCGLSPKHKRGHRSVTALFSEKFIRMGIFPAEIGRFLGQLETDRLTGDYDVVKKLTVEDAHECIEKAERISEAVRNYIEENEEIGL